MTALLPTLLSAPPPPPVLLLVAADCAAALHANLPWLRPCLSQVVFQVLTKSRPLVISLLGEPAKGAKRALLGQTKLPLEDLPEEKDMRCDESVHWLTSWLCVLTRAPPPSLCACVLLCCW